MQSQKKLIKSHKSGEMSVYLCLVFTLMVSIIITAIGTARRAAVQTLFECATESMLCSVFGEYNKELLERYDLLFIDLSYLSNSPDPMNLEARMNMYLEDNLHPEYGTSLLSYSDITDVTASNVSLTGYELATDNRGRPFINEVVDYMKNLVGIQDLENITNLVTVFDSYEINEEKYEGVKEEAISGTEMINEDSWEQTEIKEGIQTIIIPDIDFMAMLGPNMLSVSDRKVNLVELATIRQLEKGVGFEKEINWDLTERIYYNEYILSKFGSYVAPLEDTELCYEVEYILMGLGSDYTDLCHTVKTIYKMRLLEDMIALNMAEDKMEAIRSVTVPIAAAIEIPDVILTELVVYVWAYAESFTDVWLLLDGKSVPFLKSSDQFNISLKGILPFGEEMIEGRLEIGDKLPDEEIVSNEETTVPGFELSYTDYLRVMLYLEPPELNVYRVMDLIEQNLRKYGSGENMYFRFDCCVDKIRVKVSCESGYGYSFVTEKEYSYI